MRRGGGGPGSWVRIYANHEHVFAVIAGLRWDTTSEEGDGHGPGGAMDNLGCATLYGGTSHRLRSAIRLFGP